MNCDRASAPSPPAPIGLTCCPKHDRGRVTRYAGYGSVLYTQGGWSLPRNAWVGALGYRSTQMRHAEQYVRARHYATTEARWTTVDPLWPSESAYVYVLSNPAGYVDPSGLKIRVSGDCRGDAGISDLCKKMNNTKLPDITYSMLERLTSQGFPNINSGSINNPMNFYV